MKSSKKPQKSKKTTTAMKLRDLPARKKVTAGFTPREKGEK